MALIHLKISEKWKKAKSEEGKMGNSCSFGGTKKQKLPEFVPVGLRQYFSFSSIPWFHFFFPRLVKNQKKRANLRWFHKNIFWHLRRGQNLSLVFILGAGWLILYQYDKIQNDTISSILINRNASLNGQVEGEGRRPIAWEEVERENQLANLRLDSSPSTFNLMIIIPTVKISCSSSSW